MKRALSGFLRSSAQVGEWRRRYDVYYGPVTRIYDSSLNALMAELSPFFASYMRNAHLLCSGLYEWLNSPDGAALKGKMERLLDGAFDIDRWSHGELMAMCYFSDASGKG